MLVQIKEENHQLASVIKKLKEDNLLLADFVKDLEDTIAKNEVDHAKHVKNLQLELADLIDFSERSTL